MSTADSQSPALDDPERLRQRIAELEGALRAREEAEAALRDEIWTLHEILNKLPFAIYWKDQTLVYRGCNQRFADDIGLATPQEIVGRSDEDLPWQPGEAEAFRALDREVMAADAPRYDDETAIFPDGTQEWFETYKLPLHSPGGEVVGVLATYNNVTTRKQAEATVRDQAAQLLELSTPIIPFHRDVLLMPLVGAIDSARAQRVLDVLLHGLAEHQAQVVIIDITGVPVVDTQVDALVQAARAVTLLGARVVLTGIRPEVAQTLVGLGVSMDNIVTRGTLQSGISYAMGGA